MPAKAPASPPTRTDGEEEIVGALKAAYRSAMTAADAYRAVRDAIKPEAGSLRLGNRFVPIDQYREIAFLAFGGAASTLALAAWESLGERLTQGYVAGPTPLPPSVPFQSVVLPFGRPGRSEAIATAAAARELAAGLSAGDLLLVLLSPGAIAGLAEPPTGWDGGEWNRFLDGAAAAGASGPDLDELARVLGGGPAGGRLLPDGSAAEVETLVLSRGPAPERVGGGPTVPLGPDEPAEVRAILEKAPPGLGAPPVPGPAGTAPVRGRGPRRPLVLLSPEDALAGASDALVERKWFCRLAWVTDGAAPEIAAQRLIERAEDILAREFGTIPGSGSTTRRAERTAGLAVLGGLTLGGPEGSGEAEAINAFLRTAALRLTRRESVAAVLPTAGRPGAEGAGGWVRAGGKPEHPFAMPPGLTDVGLVGLVLLPAAPPGAPRTGRAVSGAPALPDRSGR